MAAAEARLLAELSRVGRVEPTEPLRAGELPAAEATQPQWRGPQARWEAEAAEEPVGRRYAFGEVFARGGIGAVRRAEDRKLGRTVAVKELLRFDEGAVRRFAREAEITARLQHPGIVPLYDVGRDARGQPFLCMKLVEGDTLEAAIAGCEGLAQRLRLLPHLIAASDAVAYAHRHQVIHRDLKPGNILVGEFGETVVIDWGLAKDLSLGTASEPPEVGAASTGSDLTEAGSLLGTLRYMPPEQARGLAVDARSDVYALGASLLHLLRGQPPFHPLQRAPLLQAVLDGAPRVTDPGLPRALVAIAERAMRRLPDERYASAELFAEDLRRFTAGRLVGAHDYSLAEIARLWLRRQRTPAMVAAASIVALTVMGGVAVGRIAAARGEAEAGQAAALAAGALAEQRAAAAETARALADRRSDELRLMQAQTVVTDDPRAAIGWLAQLGAGAELTEAARTIALAARAAGLASRTLRGPAGAVEIASSLADGTIVARAEDGALWRWAPGSEQGEAIGGGGTLVVAADGRHFAVVREAGIELWRAGAAKRTIAVELPPRWNAELCADGSLLVVHANGAGRATTTVVELASGAATVLGVDEGP
ncbi:MAG: serine/threonine protein kinase, partial [Myxococcales bacterium]|nr:serine/threonine protein kinase [Myxococcales bacterium]